MKREKFKFLAVFIGVVLLVLIMFLIISSVSNFVKSGKSDVDSLKKVDEYLYERMSNYNITYTYGVYEVVLEKVYYEKNTGEGCMVYSVKSGENIDLSTDTRFDSETGDLWLCKKGITEFEYVIDTFGCDFDYEIKDNIIYITAYIHTGNGQKYTDIKKAIRFYDGSVSRGLVDCEEKCEGIFMPDTSECRVFSINEYANVYLSATSIYSDYDIKEMSIIFKDGTKKNVVSNLRANPEFIDEKYYDGQKCVFINVINISEIDYIIFKGEKLEEI